MLIEQLETFDIEAAEMTEEEDRAKILEEINRLFDGENIGKLVVKL